MIGAIIFTLAVFILGAAIGHSVGWLRGAAGRRQTRDRWITAAYQQGWVDSLEHLGAQVRQASEPDPKFAVGASHYHAQIHAARNGTQ